MEWSEEDDAALDADTALDLLADDEHEEQGEETPPGERQVGEEPRVSPDAEARDREAESPPDSSRWPPLEPAPRLALTPRAYQEEALDAWSAAGSRGVVVLP